MKIFNAFIHRTASRRLFLSQKNTALKEIRNIIAAYDAANHETEKLALATVVNVEESSYRRIGARMLVSSNGNWIGGISGGCLEGDALKRSQMAIFKNKASRVVYDTMDEDQNQIGIGLGCNGRIEVLFQPIDFEDKNNPVEVLREIVGLNRSTILLSIIDHSNHLGKSKLTTPTASNIDFLDLDKETLASGIEKATTKKRAVILSVNKEKETFKILVEFIRPETRLIIVGDNYDVNALVGIGKELGWNMYVVGRKKKMSRQIYAAALQVYEYEEFDKIAIDEYTAVVLMSHDYNWDKQMLPSILALKPPYLGMLGPKKRVEKMREELGDVDYNQLHFFHAPVGLDIGAESPEEIALSITAEILAVFRNRDGSRLKYREGAIHERD